MVVSIVTLLLLVALVCGPPPMLLVALRTASGLPKPPPMPPPPPPPEVALEFPAVVPSRFVLFVPVVVAETEKLVALMWFGLLVLWL